MILIIPATLRTVLVYLRTSLDAANGVKGVRHDTSVTFTGGAVSLSLTATVRPTRHQTRQSSRREEHMNAVLYVSQRRLARRSLAYDGIKTPCGKMMSKLTVACGCGYTVNSHIRRGYAQGVWTGPTHRSPFCPTPRRAALHRSHLCTC